MTEQENERMAVLEKRFQNWITSEETEQSLCNDIKEYIPLYIKKFEANEELAKINISSLLNTYQKDITRLILPSDINRLLAKYSSPTAPVQQTSTPAQQTTNKMQEQIDFLTQQIEILQKTLDNTQTTNLQLKQQINTLQSKGANMSEPVETTQANQQWEYMSTRLTGGLNELNKRGEQGWDVVDGLKLDAGRELVLKRPKQKKKPQDYGYGR
jgi:uncharacterized protein YoxC